MVKKNIKSWGNNFSKYVEISTSISNMGSINVGNQNSYGDCFIPHSKKAISSLKKRSGKTLLDSKTTISEYIKNENSYLYGIPGKSNVTLAGALASDTHGKDNLWGGSFSKNISNFDLRISNNEIINCSLNENFEVFEATIGGYGLTGCIENIEFKPNDIPKVFTLEKSTIKGESFESLFSNFKESKFEYWVAWINLYSRNYEFVIEKSQFVDDQSKVSIKNNKNYEFEKISLPFIGRNLFNTMSFINKTYYKISRDNTKKVTSYEKVLYPLSLMSDTRNISSKRKILQIQFSIPLKNEKYIEELVSTLIYKQTPLLCSVKRINDKRFKNNLSFVQNGWTLAIDFPEKYFNFKSYENFTNKLIKYEGKIYLAKDSLLDKKNFREMYPEFKEWSKNLKKIDPNRKFRSALSERLELK